MSSLFSALFFLLLLSLSFSFSFCPHYLFLFLPPSLSSSTKTLVTVFTQPSPASKGQGSRCWHIFVGLPFYSPLILKATQLLTPLSAQAQRRFPVPVLANGRWHVARAVTDNEAHVLQIHQTATLPHQAGQRGASDSVCHYEAWVSFLLELRSQPVEKRPLQQLHTNINLLFNGWLKCALCLCRCVHTCVCVRACMSIRVYMRENSDSEPHAIYNLLFFIACIRFLLWYLGIVWVNSRLPTRFLLLRMRMMLYQSMDEWLTTQVNINHRPHIYNLY